MKIAFKLYASARDTIGESKVEIEVDGITILYAFVQELQEKFPQYDFSICKYGKGSRYIDLTTPLFEGDLISVIPPVSGG
jgi:molybdopterin converting factor small subunit